MAEYTETRFAYGEALLELGKERSEIVVLDADLWKSTRTVLFAEAFPDRFFDMGIAEQDMISTAAGMAASGLIPFANSFAMFITARCYDQIRTQVCYPALPVKLVGSSAGLTQGTDGASHQSLEDISLMRSLPNTTVLSPADDLETRQMTFEVANCTGPVYIRLGRYPVPRLFESDYRFEIGKLTSMREGKDVVIFATGHMVWKALDAAESLSKERIDARVVNVSTIKPMNEDRIRELASDTGLAVTVEEHSIIGGLGSAVAECLSGAKDMPALLRLGMRDRFGESGSADELLVKYGLQPEGICASVIETLRNNK